jgi:hypothetical protein
VRCVSYLAAGPSPLFDGSASMVRDQTHVLNRRGKGVYSPIDSL